MHKAFFLYISVLLFAAMPAFAQLAMSDAGVLSQQGLDVLVFNNTYPEGHQGGIEIILHDERIATNGDVRLEATPGQWDPLPTIEERIIDRKEKTIKISGAYSDLDMSYTIRVTAERQRIRVSVDLDHPLPLQWGGKIGFNLELFPPLYFGKTWHCDQDAGIFPRQANGPRKMGTNALIVDPIVSGRNLSIAPESELYHLEIESRNGDLALYDGRETDQNGWFVVRSLIPAGATRNAVEWLITPRVQKNWQRPPGIRLSQVGYHPEQQKTVVIELDPQTQDLGKIEVVKLLQNGRTKTVASGVPKRWGRFLRYDYALFDFSDVVDPGMYYANYNGVWSSPFQIARDIYQNDVWQPTLDTFFPVQMCHMEIRDRFRVWHGLCHMDDALQAPTSHEHFDGYRQGETTESRFKPFEHIDGLNVGGWHDAGDYDLATGGQAQTVYTLALAYEAFAVMRDQTTILQAENYVELHTPDGRNDVLQQIEHGVLFLLSGYRTIGHAFIGVISPTIRQYVHLGDAMSMTDNVVYDATTDVLPAANYRRGMMDDRWAFTNRDSGLEFRVAATLAAAARVLENYDAFLAQECLETAEEIWDYEKRHSSVRHNAAYVPGDMPVEKVIAAVELFKSTKNQQYKSALLKSLPDIRDNIEETGWAIAQVFAELHDDTFDHEFFKAIRKLNENIKNANAENPFGVPYSKSIWGPGWRMQSFAVKHYYLHKAFPELFDRENVLRVINFVLGCHPGSSTSFVSGVGAQSVTTAYGANRADFSYIPGGVISGTALIRPNLPELKQPWPYLWQQTEYVMHGAASYIFCILAADDLLSE